MKKYTKEGLNATYSALLGMLKCGTIDQKTLNDFEEKNRIFEVWKELPEDYHKESELWDSTTSDGLD